MCLTAFKSSFIAYGTKQMIIYPYLHLFFCEWRNDYNGRVDNALSFYLRSLLNVSLYLFNSDFSSTVLCKLLTVITYDRYPFKVE